MTSTSESTRLSDSDMVIAGPSGLQRTSAATDVEAEAMETIESSDLAADGDIGHISSAGDMADQEMPKKKRRYAQKFQDGWKVKYRWLKNGDNNQVCCTVCNYSFHCSTYNIKRHQVSAIHSENTKKLKGTPKIDLTINTRLEKLKVEKHYQLVKQAELKICAFLHEHNLPFLLADHLTKFIPSICPDSSIAKDINCSRTKATYITNNCLNMEQMEVISGLLKKCKFSLIIDETTDVSTQKSLALVVRYYDDSLQCVRDSFFGLLKLELSNAESIFLAIKTYLLKFNIPIDNLIGLAADNASVMQGNKTGVQARFKKDLPHIYILACVCHSVHLCSSAAANKLPRSVEDFVRNIYNYFSNSSKRIDQLNECQIFCQLKPKKLLHPAQTRWLSLQAAVDRVIENWEPLILFFTNENFNQNLHSSHNILESLKNPIYKLYFYFLSYILDIINKLNIEFQSEKNKLHLLLKRTSSLYKNILRNFLAPDYLKINENSLKNIDPKNPKNFLPIEKIYFGTRVELFSYENINKTEVNNFRLKCLEFYIELSAQLKSRFDFEDPVLKFVQVFDPKEAISGHVSSIALEANKYFPNLINDIEKLNSEWRILPDTPHLKNYIDLDFEKFWSIIFNLKDEMDEAMFPHLSHLVKAIICLPHSSAAAERIFSQLFLLKSKVRNRLTIETCSNILHTKEMISNNTCYSWKPSERLMKRKFKD